MVMGNEADIIHLIIYQTLTKMGLNANEIFSAISLSTSKALNKHAHYSYKLSILEDFWNSAVQISGDKDIGLHLGHNMPVFRGWIFEYLFLSSETFGDGLRRSLNYQPLALLTTNYSAGLRIEKDKAVLTGVEFPIRHALEITICMVLKFFKFITEGKFQPSEIWLTYNKGASPQEYQTIFGCNVRLGMPEGCIFFDASLLNHPSPAAEPELLKYHVQIAERQLNTLLKHQLVKDIEKVLGSGVLESRKFDQSVVAHKLDYNLQDFRYNLQSINTSFEKILSNYREKLAKRLLETTDEAIDQIVYLTGYSEPSSFNRAFKGWTGETPIAYRLKKKSNRA